MPDPTIFIVDDDEAVRDSLLLLLEGSGFATVVAYESAQAFLETAPVQAGDCLLLDVRMPGMDGHTLLSELVHRGIAIPVIVMTGHGDVPQAVRAMKAGAADFIEKPFAGAVMVESIRRALAHSASHSRETQEAEETRRRLALLTPREREVLDGMVGGQPNKVIAYGLGISPRTVEIHRARVMEKMQVQNLSMLVRRALAAGIEPR